MSALRKLIEQTVELEEQYRVEVQEVNRLLEEIYPEVKSVVVETLPNENGNGNGKNKLTLKEVEKKHNEAIRVVKQVGLMAGIIHHNQTGPVRQS